MVKKFTIPFASQGDANEIPDALQVDGKVSYTQGFGYDYERPYDDPQSKDINREDMNGIFKAITSAIGEMQQLGASEYDNSLKYPKGAIVYYNKDLYISQVDDNANTPPQQWTSIKNIADDSLKKAMNLSDLTNVATARKNLGLGNTATLNKTDVLGASSDLLATQKLVNDTNINLTNAIAKKWDTQTTVGTGNIVRKSITDSLDTRVTSAHNRADNAYSVAENAIPSSKKTSVLGSSTDLVATQKLVNDIANRIKINTASKEQNGWWKCGDTGIVVQWGLIKDMSNNEKRAVSFPISFTHSIFSISCAQFVKGNTTVDNILQVREADAKGFTAYNNDTGGVAGIMSHTYIAIGY